MKLLGELPAPLCLLVGMRELVDEALAHLTEKDWSSQLYIEKLLVKLFSSHATFQEK